MSDFLMELTEDWLGRCILALMALLSVLVVVFVAVMIDESVRPCLRAEWVRHGAYTQFILAGKVMVPIHHPARTSCDCVARGERFEPEPMQAASCPQRVKESER